MAKFRVKSLMFDLDNTLYDERQYFALAFQDISRYLAPLCNAEAERLWAFLNAEFEEKGSQYPRFFEFILKKLGIFSPVLDAEVLRLYESVGGTLTLYPDAQELLARLQGNTKMAIITNGRVEAQSNKAKLLGVAPYVDYICYARKLGKENEKPNPLPFLKTMDILGVSPKEAVYVGDDPKTDIAGARGVGMVAVRIIRGEMKDVPNLNGSHPDLEIGTMDELLAHLELG